MKNIVFLFLSLLILLGCKKQVKAENIIGSENLNYAKARNFRDIQSVDSAYYYYNKAKNDYKSSDDTLGIAQSLINMAIIQTNKGDFYGGIETSIEAEHYLKNIKNIEIRANTARNFNNMAIASAFLYNYNDAIKFYKQTLKFTNNRNDKAVYYNNMGKLLINMKRYNEAKYYLDLSLKTTTDSIDYARALNNLGYLEFLSRENSKPIKKLQEALRIRYSARNIAELNSSYATLSDYYSEKNIDSAKLYAAKMNITSRQINNPEDQLQALQKLITLDKENYSKYFKEFQSLNDSVIIGHGRAKNQFALIKSDIAKTESKNIELQTQNLKSENKLLYKNVIVMALIFLIMVGLVWYEKRRKRVQREKELEVKKTELKYSKKVHDVVANGIYQVMTKLENDLNISKDETLDDLEDVYNKSRNISYDKIALEDNPEDFSEKIRKLIGYFNTDKVKTILAGNDASVWEGVNYIKKGEVYQILRELLINMKKHSQADRVTLRFNRTDNRIEVYYLDTGIGIQKETIFKNGMRNMESRIKNLEGVVIFDTEKEKGLHINFSFPINK